MSPLFLGILTSTVLRVLSNLDNPDDGVRSMVVFVPDWRKIFYNETQTVTCFGGNAHQTYTWYRNYEKVDLNQQNFTVAPIELHQRTTFMCQFGDSVRSHPAWQDATNNLVILRVPRYVFEGDILNFDCDSRLDVDTTNAKVTFYKDSKLLKSEGPETSLFIGTADKTKSGKYKCSKEADVNGVPKVGHDEEDIKITELFSSPKLKINQNPIEVGSSMTLTCVTVLHPLRAATDLQFAFYRNGWHIQRFGPSKTFTIPSVGREESGEYSCEVQTLTGSVRKMSQMSSIQVQVLIRPKVVIHPSWDKFLRYDTVSILCHALPYPSRGDKYMWHKDNNVMAQDDQRFKFTITSDNDMGSYRCQSRTGDISDPVHLDVRFAWVILQVTSFIHEGDEITLKCHMWSTAVLINTTFYKDDQMITSTTRRTELNLGVAKKDSSGKYKCMRYMNTGKTAKFYTAEEVISVTELFSQPELKVSPPSIIEGWDMTLTCHTVLSPRRKSTELHFAFYKDGQPVQTFSTSNKYKAQSAQARDSGNYSCKVRPYSGIVLKTSKVTPIQIQGMAVVTFKPNVGKILTGEPISVFCNVDPNMKGDQTFYWYKDNEKIPETRPEFTIQSASVFDSGHYQCRSSVTHLSDPVRLDVSNSDLILQAPPIIVEDDDLILRCHHRSGLDFSQMKFYKDGVPMIISDRESDLRLGKASRIMTGAYSCTKERKSSVGTNIYIAEAFVSVTELFPYLQLKASPDLIIEGESAVLLFCETALNAALRPLHGKTELQFAFYRDRTNVQQFSTMDTYKIGLAQKKDTGNYTCEVKSSMNTVTKMSQALRVDVQDLIPALNLLVNKNPIKHWSTLTLTCDATLNLHRQATSLEYIFYKNGIIIKKYKFYNKYYVDQVTENHSGEYFCEVTDVITNVTKRSNTIKIQIQVPVAVANLKMDQQGPDVMSGRSVTFKCSVHNGTAPSFTWFHNGMKLNQNCILYNITPDGETLFIDPTEPRHSGTYQCRAKNSFASSTSNILTINVAETAPTAARFEEMKCPKTEILNPYVAPAVIMVSLVVTLALAITYSNRRRLPTPSVIFHQEQVSEFSVPSAET